MITLGCFLIFFVFTLQVTIECDLWYHVPDDDSSTFCSSSVNRTLEEDQQMLLDIEKNIANLEKSFKYRKHQVTQDPEDINDKDVEPLLQRADSSSSLEHTPKKR